MRRLALLLVATLALSGCSLLQSKNEVALRQQYNHESAALFTADGQNQWRILSPRCQQLETPEKLTQDDKIILKIYGHLTPRKLDVHILDDSHATAETTWGIPVLDEKGPGNWVKVDGAWRDDGCDQD